MGWFSSKKKEEQDILPALPSLQQVNPSLTQQQVAFQPSEDSFHSAASPISREIGHGGSSEKNDPFFVRIDKFNEAKRNLAEIEKKLREMENILVKVSETKQKEQQEIDSWKKDMKEIKNYLEEVNNSVFNKL